MVLIDASTRWSHVCLFTTRNIVLSRLVAQIIKLWTQFPYYPIKSIRLDNVGEFTSQTFTGYCMSVGINIEHPVAHTHTQNGLEESLIERLQLIAIPLLMKTKLPTLAWGHAIMHAVDLVHIRPTAYHEYSPFQLVLVKPPNISHIRIFGCAIYVPIAPTHRTKMSPQRRLGIYVGYDSPSIIRYLEPSTGDVFTTRIDIPEEQLTNESQKRLKRGRPFGSKDTTPQKRRTQRHNANIEHNAYAKAYVEQETLEEVHNKEVALEEAQVPKNSEISISYVHKGDKWDRNNIVINNIFAFQVALDIIRTDEDPKPQNVEECRNRNDWPKWKEAM